MYLGRRPKTEMRCFPYLKPRTSPNRAKAALPKISPTIRGQLVPDHTCVCKKIPSSRDTDGNYSFPFIISAFSRSGLSGFAYFALLSPAARADDQNLFVYPPPAPRAFQEGHPVGVPRFLRPVPSIRVYKNGGDGAVPSVLHPISYSRDSPLGAFTRLIARCISR